jgi:hypothetical protein
MNCAVSGGYMAAAMTRAENIAIQMETKGIYEEGDYSIFPARIGEYRLFTVKYKASSIGRNYDDMKKAIEEFLKMTEK